MSSSDSELDEFFDAKESLMSPTLLVSGRHNALAQRFVFNVQVILLPPAIFNLHLFTCQQIY